MPCAPTRSVARPRPPHSDPVPRRLRRWLQRELPTLRATLETSAAACAADAGRKHFFSFAHACLLLYHGLRGGPSLRQSYESFGACPGLVQLSGLAHHAAPEAGLAVSFSQFALSNTTRPATFLAGSVASLLGRLQQQGQGQALPCPGDLVIQDSTFLRLSLKLSPWLPPDRRARASIGVRVQFHYRPALDLPEHVLVTDTRRNDCTGLDAALLDDPLRLAALAGHTLVVDLGYYSHARFARLRAAAVHFVSRLQPQARVTVVGTQEVPYPFAGLDAGRITVRQDARVTVGSATNRGGTVLAGLRLVTAEVAPTLAAARLGKPVQTYQILTDRGDLPALEVVQLYVWRWQIELFFRWLKTHLHLSHLLGYSLNAVRLTVWLALLVHLLTLLAACALGYQRRSPALRARVAITFLQLTVAAVTALADAPRQLPLLPVALSPPLAEPYRTT